jgi:hypothetical protein
MTALKYGKRPATVDVRDAKLSDFLPGLRKAGLLPKPPAVFGHGNDFSNWLMLANGPAEATDEFPDDWTAAREGCGDCAWAGPAHETMELCRNAGRPVPRFTGAVIVEQYGEYSGYDPRTGENDNGSDVREVLKWRQTTGLRDADGNVHKIGPYLALEPKNLDELFYADYLLECCGLGVEVFARNEQQFAEGKPWTPGGEVVGGHYVPSTGRPRAGYFAFISWGKRVEGTDAFYTTANDESWGYVSTEMFKAATGLDYEGYDAAQVEQFLTETARAKAVDL